MEFVAKGSCLVVEEARGYGGCRKVGRVEDAKWNASRLNAPCKGLTKLAAFLAGPTPEEKPGGPMTSSHSLEATEPITGHILIRALSAVRLHRHFDGSTVIFMACF
jgi:hypothetical protein